MGFLCPDVRILDVTGLTDRHIAKSPGGFLQKDYDPHYVLDQSPAYIVIVMTAGPGGTLVPWTPMEKRLVKSAAFRKYRQVPPVREGPPRLQAVALGLSAERVFPHAHPDAEYLLAAYRRGP